MTYTHFVGIDIAARSASISLRTADSRPSDAWQIDQQPTAYAQLVARLRAHAEPAQTLVVLEATGNYWLRLALQLHQHGFVVSVINPVQPKHFARMRLQRTKTDAVDARLLADFACLVQPEPWSPPPAIHDQLQQRLALREDFLAQRTQQRNRLHALRQSPAAEPTVVARVQQHLDFLQQQIGALTDEIDHLLQRDHAWAAAARRLRTIPGVGPITAAWLLVATHAFERCDTPEQAAAYAGLAPHARDSGSQRGQRSVGNGGHKALRDCLYMAAGVAARFNPRLQGVYERLLARGKAKKVARCAVARKLVHQAWAVVTKQQDFDPDSVPIRLAT
jgi:transposase